MQPKLEQIKLLHDEDYEKATCTCVLDCTHPVSFESCEVIVLRDPSQDSAKKDGIYNVFNVYDNTAYIANIAMSYLHSGHLRIRQACFTCAGSFPLS